MTQPQPKLEVVEVLPRIWKASESAKSKPIQWLGKYFLPRGMVTILVGDEGIGKSLSWVEIVAAITTGTASKAWNIEAGEPQSAILMLAENGWCDMDRPRLEAAGADLRNVYFIAHNNDGSGAPMLSSYTQSLIREFAAEQPPALIVADPWLDTVPPDLNVKDGQQAKAALRPWRDLAVRHNVAVLLIAHTNRTYSANARDLYGATAELRKTARLTLFAMRDEETGALVIGTEKSNIIPPNSKALEFSIKTKTVDGFPDGVPVLKFDGHSDRSISELITQRFEDAKQQSDLGERSEEILQCVRSLTEGETQWSTVTPKQVAEALEMDNNAAGTYLRRLTKAGKLVSPNRGRYAVNE